MKILVTGAKGMVGTALVANLKNIKENKNRTRPGIQIDEIYESMILTLPRKSWILIVSRRILCLTWRGSTARRIRQIL